MWTWSLHTIPRGVHLALSLVMFRGQTCMSQVFFIYIYIYIFIRHIVFHTYLQIFPHQYATLTSRTSITIIYLYTVSFNTPRITIVILHMHMKFHLRCKNMFHSLVWWYVRKRRRKTMWWSCWSQLRNPLRNTRQGEPLG